MDAILRIDRRVKAHHVTGMIAAIVLLVVAVPAISPGTRDVFFSFTWPSHKN